MQIYWPNLSLFADDLDKRMPGSVKGTKDNMWKLLRQNSEATAPQVQMVRLPYVYEFDKHTHKRTAVRMQLYYLCYIIIVVYSD